MISTIYCLSLIMYMEGSITSETTKRFIADVAIERAARRNKSICEVMKEPKVFSWMWDRKSTKVDNKHLKEKYYTLAKQELTKPRIRGRYYFNECAGRTKKYETPYSVIRADKLCFY